MQVRKRALMLKREVYKLSKLLKRSNYIYKFEENKI
tara:strand:- start:1529 stop:1636 length:108 start_codon:yes stop_codon:yes gene_type:complete